MTFVEVVAAGKLKYIAPFLILNTNNKLGINMNQLLQTLVAAAILAIAPTAVVWGTMTEALSNLKETVGTLQVTVNTLQTSLASANGRETTLATKHDLYIMKEDIVEAVDTKVDKALSRHRTNFHGTKEGG